ncbi:MAG: heme ABC transporter ATP-binding protein [Chloroflexi bacterium]|nr:heme ABC transporter ATP-binding protein [Chloroflexota bacterium]
MIAQPAAVLPLPGAAVQAQTVLAANEIDFAYSDQSVLHAVDLVLQRGDLVALIGPNGSGKTTLLKVLCGVLKPRGGRVEWNGGRIERLERREVARHIALVPQELNVPFAFTVREMVSLGRTPHVRPLLGEMTRDRRAVEHALELTDARAFADRYFADLSGGERQRVIIAMALAQVVDLADSCRPSVLLLDEPTVHLDINHQVEVLDLVRRLNGERGLTVLATMHDLNLAALYFDRLVLLNEGRVITQGTPGQVLSKERVRDVFRAEVVIEAHPTKADVPYVIVVPTNGNGKTPT